MVSVPLASAKWQKSNQTVNLTLHFLPVAILVKLSREVLSEKPTAHAFIERRDMKSEACLASQPKSKQSKVVHSAVRINCEARHQVRSENKDTSIALVAMGKGSVRHLP